MGVTADQVVDFFSRFFLSAILYLIAEWCILVGFWGNLVHWHDTEYEYEELVVQLDEVPAGATPANAGKKHKKKKKKHKKDRRASKASAPAGEHPVADASAED